MSHEEIRDGNGRLLAVVLRGHRESPGIEFLTGPECPLQLGWMRRPQGYVVPAHTHKPILRRVQGTAEVLAVDRGRVRVTLYADGYEHQQVDLGPGDAIGLYAGGHKIEVLEDASLKEIKQGPYAGPDDKVFLAGG